MYIHSVKLINFKSIGDYSEVEVILEPRVTAIIGKNESGKSNVLEGLSYINFLTIPAIRVHCCDIIRSDLLQDIFLQSYDPAL